MQSFWKALLKEVGGIVARDFCVTFSNWRLVRVRVPRWVSEGLSNTLHVTASTEKVIENWPTQTSMEGEDEEDYGDYVTRCVCGFKHDDGYMICCDGCSVWQHLECMKIDPNHIPDKYLCEQCEPRSVDRKRARQIQVKKKEKAQRSGNKLRSVSRVEPEQNDNGSSEDSRKPASPHPGGPQSHRKRRRGKHLEARVRSDSRKRRKDDRRPAKKKVTPSRGHLSEPPASFVTTTTVATSGLQTLLNAASLLEESTSQYLWDTDTSPWTDKYDTAELNRYSEPVRSFLSSRLSQLKTEALVYNKDDYSTIESRKPQPQCCEQQKRKGVMAECAVEKDELIMEYKGKITVKHAVLSDASIGGKSLWKHKPCPFVYLYDKISDLDLCIDARHYGNIARFIRRSCTPNAEVRHFFVASELRFGIYALKRIDAGDEVTVPFDFRYEKCDYPVECACGQRASCLVVRANHAILNRKMTPKGGTEEEQVCQSKQHGTAVPPTEDSNSSLASTGSRKRVTRSQHHLLATPLSTITNRLLITRVEMQDHQDGQESHEDLEAQAKGKASQSREERKNEAVWKVFEKMEASSTRRKHQLMSEDSDPLPSSPSIIPPTTPNVLDPKHRRLSTGQRNSMLPCGRVRLSSVSSDPFSPADVSETFSPPITPKHHASQDLFCIPHSPLTMDTPRCRLEFEATPYLHPKYLLSSFELPWKKAVLRQLEMAQYGFGQHTWTYSYSSHNRTNGKIRARGSQKHRWLRLHADDITKMLSGKENQGMSQGAKEHDLLPAKKHLLMKWEKSHSGQENVCGSAVPPTRPHPPPKGGDRNSSPLFDEVSSEGEDFEVADRGGSRRHALGLSSSDVRRRSHSQTAAAQAFPPPKDSDPPLHAPDVVHVGNEEEESVVVVVGPRTPLGNDDCSMDSCYSRPTDEDDANNSLDSSVVAGKADVDYHRGACGEVGPRTPPPLPVDGVAVARQTADSCEGTRALGPSLGTRPAGRDSVDEGEAGGGGYDGTSDANKSDLFEGGSECSFRQDEDSPMSPHNKSGNQGGKKKISLGDYLKRPRKPPDQRKPPPLPPAPLPDPPVVSSYMTSLQTSSSTAVTPTTTGYTAVSPTTAGTTPLSSSMTPSASGSGGLQFEPVSPGDEDGTPPLVTMEGQYDH
ncbi:hypothetical protein EMCRGX_G000692 [Ephydatia muelleri]